MKHFYLQQFVIILLLVFFVTNEVNAQHGNGNNKNKEDYTDEEYQQWEDSLKMALFPRAEIMTSSDDTDISMKMPEQSDDSERSLPVAAESITPTLVTIDNSKAVGSIPITSGISPSGSATFHVPIDIYPGSNNIQPQLALVYNSLSGNGELGMGWSVSGIPTITRAGKSIHYDNEAEGITLNKDDAFYLDGMRLIKTSSATTYIRYESELGNIRVIAYLNGEVVKYFKVLYPNGQTGIFGNSSNTISKYLEYPLMSITDLHGNEIKYTYLYSYGHYLITSIKYGENSAASVVFTYTTGRSDVNVAYKGGLDIRESRLLQKIDCKYGTNILHTYGFEYSTQRNTSVLSKINYTAGAESYNPLVFSYGTGSTQNSYNKSTCQLFQWYNTNDNPEQVRFAKGKFDYGSDDDGLISILNQNSYWNHYRHKTTFRHSQNRYDNMYEGDEKIFFYGGLSSDFATYIPYVLTEANFIDIFCANVDGKYEEEVVKVNNGVSGSYDKVSFKVYRSSLYSGLALKYTRDFNFSTVLTDADGDKSVHPKFYFTGDFNGNGKMEVLAVSNHNPIDNTSITSKCYLFDLESNKKLYEGYAFPYIVDFLGTRQTDADAAQENTDRLFVMDYDGDGKSDVCLINDLGTSIYTFDISGSSYTMRKVATYTGLKKPALAGRTFLPGEFDGDGLIDILVSPSSGTTWEMYHSKGNGQFYKTTFTGTTNTTATNSGFLLQDLNGDGLSDLIKYTSSEYYTYLTKNGKPSSSDGYQSKTTYAKLISTNINSQNIFNQLVTVKNGVATCYRFQRDDQRERMLTSAVNGFGVESICDYQRLNSSAYNSSGPLYTKGSGAIFPYENFKAPIWVVSARETWLDGSKKEAFSYSYQNAVIHKQGLGFRGFQKINTYDNITYRSSSTEINPYNYSIPVKDESYLARNTYQYSVSVLSDKRVKLRLTQNAAYDKRTQQTVTTAYTYDTYGNLLTQTSTYPGSITVKTTNVYSNYTSDASYLLGFLYNQTVTTTKDGNSWATGFLYPPNTYSNGLPSVKTFIKNGHTVGYETYTYDSFGKVKTVKEKQFSSAELTTSFTYDTYGHPLTETNPMGQTVTYHYDTKGLMDWSKNHRNQQTNYSYDAFGRQTQSEDALGLTTNTSYTWENAATGGIYCVSQTSTGQPSQKAWYDAFGREVRTASQRYDGQWSKTDTKYDSYGRVQKTSLPFTGSSATYWNTIAYDSYDQVKTLTSASGKQTTHTYSGLKVTTVNEGISTARTYDTLGNMIKSEDPGGTITYNLRPDGQPSSIVAPGGVTTSFGYDNYGRQTSLNDPSAGITTYTYNPAGLIQTVTDARGMATTTTYDTYGRVIGESRPEFSTTYSYKTGEDLLASVNSNNGTTTIYAYDTYGRVTSDKETEPGGNSIEKRYAYNTDGRLRFTEYYINGSIEGLEQNRYANGHVQEIYFNGNSIFKITEQNALGQTTKVTTGAVARQYSYNAYGIPTGRMASRLLNSTYNFEASTGNLLSRKDNTRNKTESFGYDGLNRLTSYGSYIAGYDGKGNLTQKNDVGTFGYNNTAKPYAISDATLTSSAVPQRAQTISYNSFQQPQTISENSYVANFTYNASGQRVKMVVSNGTQTELERLYLGGCYEKDTDAAGTVKQKLYIGGGYYSAPMVYVKVGSGSWQTYFICRDYLGSITHLASSTGSLTQELSFDAWGRLRNPSNHLAYTPGNEPALFLGRGYTGHEHLPWFGLINMNGRLYDPAVGRFLSPDNYVQAPDFSQSYNRYGYCINNPLKYTDPNGEFFWTIFTGAVDFISTAFFKGGLDPTSKTARQNAWRDFDPTASWSKTNKAWKIDKGLFKTDSNKGFFGRAWELVSRFTWQLPQTTLGYTASGTHNVLGGVRSVDYYGGATVVESYSEGWGGITLGSYINGQRGINADPSDRLFQHEYGHYIQSQTSGWFYLSKYGIPSSLSKDPHSLHPAEQDANVRAFRYFSKHEDGFNWEDQWGNQRTKWKYSYNPINGYDWSKPYNDSGNQTALQNGRLKLSWYDYLIGPSIIIPGLLNTVILNNKY